MIHVNGKVQLSVPASTVYKIVHCKFHHGHQSAGDASTGRQARPRSRQCQWLTTVTRPVRDTVRDGRPETESFFFPRIYLSAITWRSCAARAPQWFFWFKKKKCKSKKNVQQLRPAITCRKLSFLQMPCLLAVCTLLVFTKQNVQRRQQRTSPSLPLPTARRHHTRAPSSRTSRSSQ